MMQGTGLEFVMNILEQLQKPDFKPSKSDRLLMKYLKESAAEAVHLPISEIAQNSGVAEATVTRFVRKFGFSNLSEFKMALAGALTDNSQRYIINPDITTTETVMVTARKLLDANIGMLEKTLHCLDGDCIDKSSMLLLQARQVYFIGMGNSGYMANDSSYKFFRIGLDCRGIDNSHTMMMMMALIKPDDLVVVISHSGETQEVIKTVELARQNGAAIIVITANRMSRLIDLADAAVLYKAQETLLETGSISVKLAQFFIMDLIYTQVVKAMADKAAENKRLTTQAVGRLR